ncbi:Semaphorin-6A [Schistosoma japonicum]|nr:Semaphorin-6A [Schistosoma japonicum]
MITWNSKHEDYLNCINIYRFKYSIFVLIYCILQLINLNLSIESNLKWLIYSNQIVDTFSIKDLISMGQGTIFYHLHSGNYTNLLELPYLNSIFVIGNRNAMFRLNPENLRLLASFELPSKPVTSFCMANTKAPCTETPAFNLLLQTHDKQNIWYCYLYQTIYMSHNIIPNVQSARCEIPSPLSLEPESRLVQWENSVYSSLDINRPGVSLMASDGFLYSSGWFHGAMRIHRSRLPNFDGKANWNQFLATPPDEIFLKESTHFICAFETVNSVYFLIRELKSPQCEARIHNRFVKTSSSSTSADGNAFSSSSSSSFSKSSTKKTTSINETPVTRLVRICKDDPGGYQYVNEGEFVTFSKVTLECKYHQDQALTYYHYYHHKTINKQEQVNDSLLVTEFSYGYSVAGKWDPLDSKLYVSYQTGMKHPTGDALCVYSLNDIEDAFNSELAPNENSDKTQTLPNTFENICQKLNSGVLTKLTVDKIRQLPRSHLLRVKHVQPIDNRPLIIRPVPGLPFKQTNLLGWYHIEVDHNDRNVILYLAGKQHIERYGLFNLSTEDSIEICPWDQLTIEDFGIENEIITGVYMKHIKPSKEFYVLTSKHVIQLPKFIQLCETIKKSSECINTNLISCKWNNEINKCEMKSRLSLDSSTLKHHLYKENDKNYYETLLNNNILSKFSTINPFFCLFDKNKLKKNINNKLIAYWWKNLQGHIQQKDIITNQQNELIQSNQSPIICMMSTRSTIINQYQNLTCHCQPCTDCINDEIYRMEINNCQIHPSWSLWSPWSSCSSDCDYGIRTRIRRCDSPQPIEIKSSDQNTKTLVTCKHSYNIPVDQNDYSAEVEVQVEHCPQTSQVCSHKVSLSLVPEKQVYHVGEIFLKWSDWSDCSAKCGIGIKTRHLICSTIMNKWDQSDISQCTIVNSEIIDSRICENFICQQEIVHSEWTPWLRVLPNNPHILKYTAIPGRLNSQVYYEQRLRYSCGVPFESAEDLQLVRKQIVERKCFNIDQKCSSVSNIINSQTDEENRILSESIETSNSIWSSWSEWSECNQNCIPIESISSIDQLDKQQTKFSSTFLYISDQYQIRTRKCLSNVCSQNNRLDAIIDLRRCPSKPACKSGWSCWSDWSNCFPMIYDHRNKKPQCQWLNKGGKSTRTRTCILTPYDQNPEKQKTICSGYEQMKKECIWFDGDQTGCSMFNLTNMYLDIPTDVNTKYDKASVWSTWSTWSSCEAVQTQTNRHNQLQLTENVLDPTNPYLLTMRTRQCQLINVDIGEFYSLHHFKTVCSGSWNQMKTCPNLALNIAGAFGYMNKKRIKYKFTTLHIILIGLLSFVAGTIIASVGIIIYHWGYYKRYMNKNNGYSKHKSINKLKHELHPENDMNNLHSNHLNLSPPPQPILTLPIPDIVTSTMDDIHDHRKAHSIVYDSVASQDGVTYLEPNRNYQQKYNNNQLNAYSRLNYIPSSYSPDELFYRREATTAVITTHVDGMLRNDGFWSYPRTRRMTTLSNPLNLYGENFPNSSGQHYHDTLDHHHQHHYHSNLPSQFYSTDIDHLLHSKDNYDNRDKYLDNVLSTSFSSYRPSGIFDRQDIIQQQYSQSPVIMPHNHQKYRRESHIHNRTLSTISTQLEPWYASAAIGLPNSSSNSNSNRRLMSDYGTSPIDISDIHQRHHEGDGNIHEESIQFPPEMPILSERHKIYDVNSQSRLVPSISAYSHHSYGSNFLDADNRSSVWSGGDSVPFERPSNPHLREPNRYFEHPSSPLLLAPPPPSHVSPGATSLLPVTTYCTTP